MLSWTPEQTIVNFRRVDQIFAAHTIHRGANVRALPRAAVQIDPVVTQSGGLPAVSVAQLMNAERITGVIAVKNGEIILERYAFGRGPDDRWISMSVAKSVTSTLIGAAVKDGLIGSIDDPVVGYIPELKGTAFDGVMIRHLMTMSSGVRWKEDYIDLRSDIALAGGEEMVGGVPPLVILALMSLNVITVSTALALGLAAALLAVDLLAWRVVTTMFDRERLVTGRPR